MSSTTAITYTIPGARTLDQLAAPTLDGQPDEDARENCVPTSIAEGLNILTGSQAFVPDELHDAVYGQGYVGTQSAHAYIGYCAAQGVTLSAVDGTQAELVATIHREVSAGHPVVLTMPSQWGTAPADPVHPSGYTHVGVAVGIGPSGVRVMNPWPGFWQDEDDSWWAARLCYGQVWVMKKAAGATMTTAAATNGVPAGWHDNGTVLTAPNGITVGTGIREKVLSWPGGWPAWNVPLEEEHHLDALEVADPALGGGTQQVFRATVLEWAAKFPQQGTFMMAVGQELLATRKALAASEAALTTAQQQAAHDAAIIGDQQGQVAALQVELQQARAAAAQAQAASSEAQAQSGDELARGAAHAFVQAFTAAVSAALAGAGSPTAAVPAEVAQSGEAGSAAAMPGASATTGER